METLVTIIIPAYNYGQFIEEAIESALAQTVKCEIIVIDDESTDNTAELVAKYPVKYIFQKNKGLSGARNRGIMEAKGKYIMSFDADDILKPDAIENHLELMDDNSIVTCGLMAFGSENYVARPRQADLKTLLQTNVIYSNSMFPKQKAIEAGLFDESMKKGVEDWEMWIRMAEIGVEFKTSDKIGLLWRRHPSTMSDTMANPNWDENMKYFRTKHKHLYEKYNIE
jgi:glycosyltransferase involved in cell wall biosynthesis